MKGCTVEREQQGELDVIRVDGSLDAESFPHLNGTLKKLREEGRHKVVLDCGNLQYISSANLGALVAFAQSARENGGALKLAQLSDKILEIVKLLGFHKILEICPSVDKALRKF